MCGFWMFAVRRLQVQLFSLIQFKSGRFFFCFFFKRLLFRLSDLKLCIKEGFTAAADYIINPYCLTPHLLIISKNDLVESAAGRSQSSSCLPLLAFFIEGVLVL